MRPRRWFPAVCLALAWLAFAAGAADAHHTDITDPNDTKGRLDIREVKVGHHPGEPAEFTVITGPDWRPIDLWDQGFFFVMLDTSGDEREEYRVMIRSDRTRLEATLWRVQKTKPDRLLRPLPVSRKSRDGVSFTIALFRLSSAGSEPYTGGGPRACSRRPTVRTPAWTWRRIRARCCSPASGRRLGAARTRSSERLRDHAQTDAFKSALKEMARIKNRQVSERCPGGGGWTATTAGDTS